MRHRVRQPIARETRAGFTLIELLAVLAILSLLGGLTATVFQIARRNYALSSSVSHVESLLQRARNTAMRARIPVKVEIDPINNRATAYAFEELGHWDFDEGGSAGYVDGCIDLRQGFVSCGDLAKYDVRFGIYADAWVLLEESLAPPERVEEDAGGSSSRRRRRRPRSSSASSSFSSSGGARVILAKGKAYALGVAADGAVEGRIGRYRVRTKPETVLPGLWTKVAMRFDGHELQIVVDGIERDAPPVGFGGADRKKWPATPELVPIDDTELTIGASKETSFPGRVDEVHLRGLVEPQEYELNPREHFLGWKKVVWFDHRGHLDPRFHDKPVRVLVYLTELEDRKDTGTKVFVDYSKTFEEWATSRGLDLAKEHMTEESEEARLEEELRNVAMKEEIFVDRIGVVR